MRLIVFVKATDDSEKGILPTTEMLEAMGRFNDELRNAGTSSAIWSCCSCRTDNTPKGKN